MLSTGWGFEPGASESEALHVDPEELEDVSSQRSFARRPLKGSVLEDCLRVFLGNWQKWMSQWNRTNNGRKIWKM